MTTISQLERQGRIVSSFANALRDWIRRLAALPVWPVGSYVEPELGPLAERIGGTMID
jgi:hypothetical protein